MNKSISFILLAVCVILYMGSCSSGAYTANPSSNANGSINPLNPLTAKQFTWAASTHLVTLDYNGTFWSCDTLSYFGYIDSLHTNLVIASAGGKTLYLYVQYGWANQVYNMGFKQYNNLAVWVPDSVSQYSPYQSSLGNSGELYATANDSVNFDGKFYFQAVNSTGAIINITNGTFNLIK